ncbi:MAG: class I SAM-dependent methyltransferase [Treponema sp.]|nr:class I SAM-dependent methyltransferase [Treponema sp.]
MHDNSELLFNRLSKRYRHLKKWARRTGINAFRLYDRDIKEIPLVLDLYDDAVSGAVYRRTDNPDNADNAAARAALERASEVWLASMKAAASSALGIPENRIFLKERRRMRQRQYSGDQYERVSTQSFYRDVLEGDIRFRVNLSDYLDTGLFLDSRKKRALIATEAAGKRVLNLFAYTCTLSVCAAQGGARQVDSVDLSNTYLEWGKVNFALNGLEAEYDDGALSLIRADVLQFIADAAHERSRWDIIILDPPGFSNSKKMRGSLDIRRDYRELIERCLVLLAPGGTLYFSSNVKGFALASEDFPAFTVTDCKAVLQDEDFRGKRIPACYTLSKKA